MRRASARVIQCAAIGLLLVSLATLTACSDSDASDAARSDSPHPGPVAAAPTAPAEGATSKSGLPRSPRPKDAELYFITPQDGDTLRSPVRVRFGLEGMGVAPAGVEKEDTGHHHLIVDAPLPPMDLPVPKSEKYLHFGNGQTEVSLDLTPGQHTLQLLLGDHLHIPHDPPVVSDRITITVEK